MEGLVPFHVASWYANSCFVCCCLFLQETANNIQAESACNASSVRPRLICPHPSHASFFCLQEIAKNIQAEAELKGVKGRVRC